MRLTARRRRGLSALKRFMYAQLYLRDAALIALGRGKPLLPFRVEATPPSLYLNFAIRPEALDALERRLDLPLPITEIACLEGDEPFACLTLNVYCVSGLANGIRAEWSVYVTDPDGTPRFLVVEAQTEKGSLDSVELFTRPGPISYVDTGGELRVEITSTEAGTISLTVPAPEDAPTVRATSQWVEANDYIYWRNGICDRTFYDAGLANPRIRRLDPAAATILHTTAWASVVDPVPRSVVVFDDAIEFAISPWWNVGDPASVPGIRV